MLKVLYLPLNVDKNSIQHGTYDAWNATGANLQICDFHTVWRESHKNTVKVEQDFLNKVREFQPNLIYMQLQFTGLISPNIIEQARKLCPGVVIANWSGDCRANVVNEFKSIANVVDYSLMSSTGHLEMYDKAGCKNIKYLQIGYDPKFNHPLNLKSFEYDAVFLGNNYGNSFPDSKLRSNAISFLQKSFPKFKAFGFGHSGNIQCVDYLKNNDVYNKSLTAISISNFNNVSHYFSDRLLHCLASGRPTISWYFPGIESYFVEGKEILVARSNEDIAAHINFCKNNLEAANQIGINGYKRVLREHTYTSRMLEVVSITGLTYLL